MNAAVETFDPHLLLDAAREHLVIVGNGPVGVHLVRELKKANYRGSITIFGEEAWEPYDRVQLSSLLKGDIKFPDICNGLTDLESNTLYQHFNCKIIAIDPSLKSVTDSVGRVFYYTKLILATGSKPHIPQTPGTDLAGVYRFRDLNDVQTLIARSTRSRHTVVIGGGLLGVEAARAMLRGHTRVTLVQHSCRLMNRQLDDAAAALIQKSLEASGVNVKLNTRVVAIKGSPQTASTSHGFGVSHIELSNGQIMDCDTVVFATGITPNIELFRSANISIGRGFRINKDLETSQKDIYSIGECAEFNGQIWGLVAPGLEQAACLAKNLCGRTTHYTGSIPSSRLKVLGLPVFSMGSVSDEHALLIDTTIVFQSLTCYRKIYLKRGRMIGAILVGACEQTASIQQAIEQGYSVLPWQIWRFRRTGHLWANDDSAAIKTWPESTIVCQCNGVSLKDIEAANKTGANTLASLQATTKAGTTCGGCTPLLSSYLGNSVAPETQRTLGLGLITLLTLIASFALLEIAPIAYSDTVTKIAWWEQLLRDSFLRQVSGFTLLGFAVLSLLLSARKRITGFKMGKFTHWRLLHAGLGVLSLIAVAVHTGFDLGSNINRWLVSSFILLALLGGLTTLVLSFSNCLPVRTTNQLRKVFSWGHLIVVWPIPAFLTLHIVSVYFF